MVSISSMRLSAFSWHTFAWILLWSQLQTAVESKAYELYSSSEIHAMLEEWKVKYPEFVRLTTAQEAYGLPAAGSPYDCPFYEENNGCPNAVLTIQDYVTHPVGSKSSNALPEVFWSGSLHGNERVGPTVVMETALLLLEAATCESLLHGTSSTISSSESATTNDTCQTTLAQSGIDDAQRRWLARLVATRRIVIVPTANALGYYRNSRTEDGIDPNRDFPYDLLDSSRCMQTIAGRTLNEVFREHLFQMALTFHGGMEVIAYEWGAPSWYGFLSPDDLAQNQIAAAYSKYGGSWPGGRSYNYGTMNDMVYFVRGGMEDWAYAGSWDYERVIPCEPTTFNGYPQEKTIYNNSTLRAFNMLIETSNSKNPIFNLGRSDNLLNQQNNDDSEFGNGHISRNIRLALLSADLVEPYVSIVQVNGVALPHDVIPQLSTPFLSANENNCGTTISVNATETSWNSNNKNNYQLEIVFTVGGALSIDQVQLWFANKNDIVSTKETAASTKNCWEQPSVSLLQSTSFAQATIVGPNSGSGQFSTNGPIPASDGRVTNGPLFFGTVEIPASVVVGTPPSEWIILASARVDQDWKNAPENDNAAGPANLQPQSHMANVRTDPNWKHEANDKGKVIQGRLDWFSQPLTVLVVTDNDDPTNAPTMIAPAAPSVIDGNDNDHDNNGSTTTIAPTNEPSFIASFGQTLIWSSAVPSSVPSSQTHNLNPTKQPSLNPTLVAAVSYQPTLSPSIGDETNPPFAKIDDDDSSGMMAFVSPSITFLACLVAIVVVPVAFAA